MVLRLLASFRSLARAIGLHRLRAFSRGAVVLICCAGLGFTSALAPFGVARMRRPDAFSQEDGIVNPDRTGAPEQRRTPDEAAVSMLQDRFQALVDGNVDRLKVNYDDKSDTGLWSWEKEASRVSYLREWAQARGVEVFDCRARVEVDSVSPDGPHAVWVEITEHVSYSYRPVSTRGNTVPAAAVHTFGSRAVHVLELIFESGNWKIRRDWYADPIGQESYLSPCKYVVEPEMEPDPGSGAEPSPEAEPGPVEVPAPQRFNREAALEYAVLHAGVPALEGSGKYNPKFRVYTFVGGDCANFASQVLEAGGLEQGSGWHYTSEGSASWVRGEDLVWHLLATGRAKRLYTGTFAGAIKRTGEYPGGVISALEPGDIIAYESKGQITHVAVVVGKDPMGYVTIASHTSDRLYFPWDMGWNDSTVFWLIKITY